MRQRTPFLHPKPEQPEPEAQACTPAPKQLCITDMPAYRRQFLQAKKHPQMHIYISNCSFRLLEPPCVNFASLRTLSLDNNNIESIESLVSMYMPHLQKLLLFNNNITSIRPLALLTATAHLSELSLSMNPLIHPQSALTQCDLPSLKQLRLYHSPSKPRGARCSHPCAKLNCHRVKQLGIDDMPGGARVRALLLTHLFMEVV